MKVSIITATYNSAATVGRTLKSVREQTHPDIEHIIVDGASKDNTLAIVAAEGPHVAKVVSEKDRGIYDAMNKGIALATGDVIGLLNSDDFLVNPDTIATIAHTMQEEGLDALYGDVGFFQPGNIEKTVRRYRSNRFSPKALAWGWMPAHPTLYLRREVYERFGVFKTDYRIAGDYEFVARIFHEGRLKYRYLPSVLVRMQMGGASTGGWRSNLLLNQETLRACRENGISTNWFKILSKYPLKMLEFARR